MLADPVPRSIARRSEYDRSDKMTTIAVPGGGVLRDLALGIESALAFETKKQAQTVCNDFLAEAVNFFRYLYQTCGQIAFENPGELTYWALSEAGMSGAIPDDRKNRGCFAYRQT